MPGPVSDTAIVAAAPALAANLRTEPDAAAEAIMTTDTRVKMASRTLLAHGTAVTLAAFCKGSGMIAPALATMIAAIRWARARGATRVVAAAPVGALQSVAQLRREADAVVCPNALADLVAVGLWYGAFDQIGDAEVVALLESAAVETAAG